MFLEDMFTTATFTLIRFAFTRYYRGNAEPIMWQQFQSFGFICSPNSIFPCRFRKITSSYLIYKMKRVHVLFWKWQNHCLCNSQKMHREHFYDCQITTRVFYHNRLCKLQLKRFPVVLLFTRIACILRNW